MEKITGFFGGLRKSTKITLLSCGCFVVLTLILTLFFILFPITPNEKIMTHIGRESIFRNDNGGGDGFSAMPEVVTTVSGQETSSGTETTVSAVSATSTVSTTHVDYTITVTMGSGFTFWKGRIPVAIMPGSTYETTTTAIEPAEPAAEPYEIPTEAPTEAYDPNAAGQDPTDWSNTGGTDWNNGGGTDWGNTGGTEWGSTGGTDWSSGGTDWGSTGGTDWSSTGGTDWSSGGTDWGSTGGTDWSSGGSTDWGSDSGSDWISGGDSYYDPNYGY